MDLVKNALEMHLVVAYHIGGPETSLRLLLGWEMLMMRGR
jgi:hypothetical protein